MNRIELIDTLPRVFEGSYAGKSDVWLRHLSFEKGKKYLISAESGGGKSSLCAFLYGYRTDYAGEIRFDGKDIAALSVDKWCAVRRRSIAYLPQEMRVFPRADSSGKRPSEERPDRIPHGRGNPPDV